jgi:deoxyribose-phosphate aldolase
MIDHSLLHPELTTPEIREGCELAGRYDVASVCVRPCDVPSSVAWLRGTGVLVGTVVGFPHGSSTTRTKVDEARHCLDDGAQELDMLLNIGWLRSGEIRRVEEDIQAVVALVRSTAGALVTVKVILENAYLSDDEKVHGCQAAERAGANFVKTSTGFAPGGATMADLRLMRRSVSPHVSVKASGGVRTLDLLLAMAKIGVSRFGATATSRILDDLDHRLRFGEPRGEPAAVASGDY